MLGPRSRRDQTKNFALQFAAGVVRSSPPPWIATYRPPPCSPPRAAGARHWRRRRLERDGVVPSIDDRFMRSYPPVLRPNPRAVRKVNASRLACDPVGHGRCLHACMAGLDIDAALARISAPALILACEHDGDRPPAGVAAVAGKIRGAQFKTLPSGAFPGSADAWNVRRRSRTSYSAALSAFDRLITSLMLVEIKRRAALLQHRHGLATAAARRGGSDRRTCE